MELYREQAMPYPHIIHHGAVTGVTGSCHQLQMEARASLLIDCGLFQGAEHSAHDATYPRISFSLEGIKALVVTHVHADHVARIPHLLAAGFEGPILCSEPSAKLLPLVLEDAFKLEFSREPKRVDRFVQRIKQQLIALPFDHWFTVAQSHRRKRFRHACVCKGRGTYSVLLMLSVTLATRKWISVTGLSSPVIWVLLKRLFYRHPSLLSVRMYWC